MVPLKLTRAEIMDEQRATFLGVSSYSSAESQEDAACVGEMQNQHLGRMFQERGTMKLNL